MNLRGRYSSIVIALLLTWGVGGDRLVSAATFYVAPGGNDGNLGTAAQPWATLQHAADVVLQSADSGWVIRRGRHVSTLVM